MLRADPPRVATGALATSVLLLLATAALGASAASAALPGSPSGAPWSWSADPSPWLVTGLLAAATGLATAGLLLGLAALGRGWSPDPRRLVLAGAVASCALLAVPPLGSADPQSYAAYGRMVALGLDPYSTAPADLGPDPYGLAVEDPWRTTPSVYGPLATAGHALAARVAGDDVRRAVLLLGVQAAMGFVGTGLLLQWLLPSPAARRRAALLWSANPLLLLLLVSGAHVDALLALPAVGAVALAARHPLLAGLAGGAAGCVKLTAGLVGAGLAAVELRSPRRLAALAVGALVVLVPAYLSVGGLAALTQARESSRFVSRATPWRPVASLLDRLLGLDASRLLISAFALAATVALAVALGRRLPPAAAGARAAAAAVLAYTFVAPYALAWYDALAIALLCLLAASAYDRLLVVHTAVLTLAYLPGRVVPLPDALEALQLVVRQGLAPLVLLGVLVLAVRSPIRRE